MFSNISGYKFVALDKLGQLKRKLLGRARQLTLRGTILLSKEGLNLALCGEAAAINEYIAFLEEDERFLNIDFKFSYSVEQSFQRMKVKLKKEIITFKQDGIVPAEHTAPYISAKELKQWYDEHRDFIILDTRNDYETELGTFENAVDFKIEQFTDFTKAVEDSDLDKSKPIVTFCTGGVRCEKAATWMQAQGFNNVYQLHGGILKYFEENGGEHYQGQCFVFDDRIAVDGQLKEMEGAN